jgi:hypothetical protein
VIATFERSESRRCEVVALLGVLQFIHVVSEAVHGGEDFAEGHDAAPGKNCCKGSVSLSSCLGVERVRGT